MATVAYLIEDSLVLICRLEVKARGGVSEEATLEESLVDTTLSGHGLKCTIESLARI